jgi:hypothetical protein
MKKSLSIITPVYNEESVVNIFYSRINSLFTSIEKKYDVNLIFINNGSDDDSLGLLYEIFKKDQRVSILSLSRNFGYQNALFYALQNVNTDLYTFLDIDCEDPPEMISSFLTYYEKGYDLVYGKRIDRDEFYFLKKLRNIFYHIIKNIADDSIYLYMAEFSLFTNEIRNSIIKQNNSFPFIRGSLASAGFNTIGIEYKRNKRVAGKTHYNFLNMFIFAFAGILTTSTFLLRFSAYLIPIILFIFIISFFDNNYISIEFTKNLILLLIYFNLSIVSLYIARIYKNLLFRPNAIISKNKTYIHKYRENTFENKDI